MVERWNPRNEMSRVVREMDEAFNDAFGRSRLFSRSRDYRPAIDIYDTGEQLVIKALVPGSKVEDLDISLEQNTLSIRGRYGYILSEEEAKKATWYQREIGSGEWAESFQLPFPVDSERVEAMFEDGVLTLHLPKADQARVKRIQVRSNKPLDEGDTQG